MSSLHCDVFESSENISILFRNHLNVPKVAMKEVKINKIDIKKQLLTLFRMANINSRFSAVNKTTVQIHEHKHTFAISHFPIPIIML